MYLRIRSQRGRPRLHLLCGAIACVAIWGLGSGFAQAQCSGGSSSGGGGGGGMMGMGGGGGGRMGGGGGAGGSGSSASSAGSALMMVQMANQAQAQRQQYLRNQAALMQAQMPVRQSSPHQEKLVARKQQRMAAKEERIAKRKEFVKNGSRAETLVATRR